MNNSVRCTKISAKNSSIKSIKCLVLPKNPPNCQPGWFSGKRGGGCEMPKPAAASKNHQGFAYWLVMWGGGRVRVRGGCVIYRLNHHPLAPKSSPYWVLCGLSWPRSLCSLSQGGQSHTSTLGSQASCGVIIWGLMCHALAPRNINIA